MTNRVKFLVYHLFFHPRDIVLHSVQRSGWGLASRNLPRRSCIVLDLPRGGGELVVTFEGHTSSKCQLSTEAMHARSVFVQQLAYVGRAWCRPEWKVRNTYFFYWVSALRPSFDSDHSLLPRCMASKSLSLAYLSPSRTVSFPAIGIHSVSCPMRGLHTKDCVLSHRTLVLWEVEARLVGTCCLLMLIFIYFSPSGVPPARPWRLISHTSFERGWLAFLKARKPKLSSVVCTSLILFWPHLHPQFWIWRPKNLPHVIVLSMIRTGSFR